MLELWSNWPEIERRLGAPAGGDELALWRARRTVEAHMARVLRHLEARRIRYSRPPLLLPLLHVSLDKELISRLDELRLRFHF